jgi:hypothetical protein
VQALLLTRVLDVPRSVLVVFVKGKETQNGKLNNTIANIVRYTIYMYSTPHVIPQ